MATPRSRRDTALPTGASDDTNTHTNTNTHTQKTRQKCFEDSKAKKTNTHSEPSHTTDTRRR